MAKMMYVFSHGLALGLLIALTWLTGHVLRSRSGVSGLGQLRSLGSLVLGLGFWIVWTFVLATLGALRPVFLAFPAVLLVAVSLATYFSKNRSREVAWHKPKLSSFSIGMVAAFLLAPLAFLAMSPPVSWDASTYHLTLPRLYLEHGGFRPVEFNVYSHWPQNIELLFALALMVMDHALAKLVHFGFGLFTLYGLLVVARAFRPGGWLVGWLAGALFLANGVVAFEMRVAYVDLAHAFFFLTSFLFLLHFRADPETRSGALFLAGVSCGLMAGVKVSGIAGVAVLSVLLLPWLFSSMRTGTLRQAVKTCSLCFLLPVLSLWLPWLVRSAASTGNPVYPLFYSTFGGPDWSSELGLRFDAWQKSIGMGREPLDYLLLPLRVILLGGRGYDSFDGSVGAFWLVLLPLAFLLVRRNPLVRRCLGISGLYFVFWALTSQQMRFLLPILPILALAAATALEEIFASLGSIRERRIARVLALLCALALVVWVNFSVLKAGYRTLGRYLEPTGNLLESVVPPVFRFINEELPRDARLLFLGTNQGFFCHREYLADSFFEASQIEAWLTPARNKDAIVELLRERGVTHILVDRTPRGVVYPQVLWQLMADQRRVEPVYESPDKKFLLLALRSFE